jgi:hypothetical protein
MLRFPTAPFPTVSLRPNAHQSHFGDWAENLSVIFASDEEKAWTLNQRKRTSIQHNLLRPAVAGLRLESGLRCGGRLKRKLEAAKLVSASRSFGLAQDRLHQVAAATAPQPYRDTPVSEVSDQLRAAALARARSSQAARKAFISARSTIIRLATPLYFFVIPVTVRVTAPWWTRP